MSGDVWLPGPRNPTLSDDELHLWRAPLKPDPPRLAALAATLSDEEHQRADRFHFGPDRDAFVLSRAALRAILARYLGQEPARLRFGASALGKPFVVGGGDLRFSSSRSHGLALYAVARAREVGVDIERVRDGVDHRAIAGRYFSADEREELEGLPEPLARPAFFTAWTRKEAILKANGQGLSAGLKDGDVSPSLAVRSLDVGPGHAAALAAEGLIGRLLTWEWQDG
ncbi:MAG TPA: 4'-phosphopantetheinyl transferase superfamily protein [Acidimicrobiales bacterium]|nr:4'-phosphopantetheinyl transferase superfamily protein [Acidimicrobiales bacterium]